MDDWKQIPVYKKTGAYARENGELELYRSSMQANSECADAIEKAIAGAFDGFHLEKGCEDSVIEQFGLERVQYVLAITLRRKNYDGRFSRRNKEWANNYPILDDGGNVEEMLETIGWRICVETHPAILDGFVDMVSFRK